MTIRELIAQLSQLDPETPVIMPGERTDFVEVVQVVLDWALTTSAGVGLAYPDEPGAAVARLVGPEGLEESYFQNSSPTDDEDD